MDGVASATDPACTPHTTTEAATTRSAKVIVKPRPYPRKGCSTNRYMMIAAATETPTATHRIEAGSSPMNELRMNTKTGQCTR